MKPFDLKTIQQNWHQYLSDQKKIEKLSIYLAQVEQDLGNISQALEENKKEITRIESSLFRKLLKGRTSRAIQRLLQEKDKLHDMQQNLLSKQEELKREINEIRARLDEYPDFKKYFYVITTRPQLFHQLSIDELKLDFRLFGTNFFQGHYIPTDELVKKLEQWLPEQIQQMIELLMTILSSYKEVVAKNLSALQSKSEKIGEFLRKKMTIPTLEDPTAFTTDSNYQAFYSAINSFLDYIILRENDSTRDLLFSDNFLQVLKKLIKKHNILMRYNAERFGAWGIFIDFGFYKFLGSRKIENEPFLGRPISYQINELENISTIVFSRVCWYDETDSSINLDPSVVTTSVDAWPQFLQDDFQAFGQEQFQKELYVAVEFHEKCHAYFDRYLSPKVTNTNLDELYLRLQDKLFVYFLNETFARLVTLFYTPLFKFETYIFKKMLYGNPGYQLSFRWLYKSICSSLEIEPHGTNIDAVLETFLTRGSEEILAKVYGIYERFCKDFPMINWPVVGYKEKGI